MNGLTKEVLNFDQPEGHKPSQGIIADSAMHTAQFMGFNPNTGVALYNGVTLGASVYSIVGLARKTGASEIISLASTRLLSQSQHNEHS